MSDEGGMTISTMDAIDAPVAEDSSTSGPDNGGSVQGEEARADSGQQEQGDAGGEVKAEAQAQDAQDGKLDRFDQHPRFQELIQTKNAQQAEIDALKAQISQLGKPVQAQQDAAPRIDVSAELAALEKKFDEGELSLPQFLAARDKFVAQEQERKITSLLTEKQQEQEQRRQIDAFLTAHPDFKDVVKSPEAQQVMRENPMHDEMSAYLAVRLAKAETALKDAEAKAYERGVKEAEAKAAANVKAKQSAMSLGSGPPAKGGGRATDAMLKNTAQYGGKTNVLVERLRERRAATQ